MFRLISVSKQLSSSSSSSKISSVLNRNAATMKGKNFMAIQDLSTAELEGLIDHSIALKEAYRGPDADRARALEPLKGISMSMIFQKRSTRTRVSTETGMFLLGGHGLMLGPQDIQMGVNETIKDTALVLSRFNEVILARVFAHSDVAELAKHATRPVINALSDKFHPLQTLADLMALKQHFKGELKGKTLSWVGDGNNVLHDLMAGALMLGMNVNVSTPVGYSPDADVVAHAHALAAANDVTLNIGHDVTATVTNAHVIVTDTWVSMGEESKAAQKKKDFEGYQVNAAMMQIADPTCVFLHCLPRKPEEVSDEVFYSPASLVFPEAENRMWTVMAVTLELLGMRYNAATGKFDK